jgi:hypothetical protein
MLCYVMHDALNMDIVGSFLLSDICFGIATLKLHTVSKIHGVHTKYVRF